MCGHVSIYYKNRNKDLEIEKLVENINHRGPNHTGIYKKDNIEFAFKRLSILDLENGSQPFEKNNNTIIFNGEIYNHNILRSNLIDKGYEFKTNCDTEVLLTSYIENKEKCVENLRGMFSFIIYDEERNLLFGARDHFGIKPLYYLDNSDFIVFSSEYKAIVNLLDEVNLNEKSLQNYLSFQYVPLENTMIEDIKLIPPGYSFTVKDGKLELKKYYKVDFIPKKHITANDVKEVVADSIKHHMDAHVEVGTFLSGGIDSTIVATIASQVNPNIKSFSVGFGVDGYDEIEVAKKTARVLGIENIDINVTQQDYIKSLPEVFYHLDDPVADPSQVGIYFLSKEAKKHATVVLSGEGADELFGGYNIYKEYNSVKPILNMPRGIKKALNGVSSVMPNIKGKSYLYRATTPLEDRYIGNAKIFENDEVRKIVKNYSENNEYQKILSSIYEEARINNYDYVTTMQHVDVNTWLEGDILQKADKMSMAQSIELRVPFLDKEVLELAKHLKIDQKISNSNTKVLLREAFKDIIPLHMVEKKKLGFPTPIRVWLKEDLGDVVRQTIHDADVDEVLNKDYAINLLDNHIKDHQDNSRKIWSIYAFCLWHQMFMENKIIKY
ncbi:asparagine synthase (glutamine-hydrolyzing) [Romboutsia lituseburensis]|uniref:asparagine synthase (glutamine-hydrolyzing) n=1 Tax=Romboutsia lituseburensis DSM 797 TaxID=1121325 RepID=A0A1G9L207_9FIRM|nr:asparagine synthase (glutamine-hydrolyzing) [Romboutsia lituseburensis]CEH35110.1 Asparagine synthetase [glutamine-hydrolyzing] 1 [Romboutsia lituseburensis]SDL55793.1 asparagine synthase (glutamine-hydrolysing) [Romboutsia lituseburensis DSM 797]